MEAEYRNSSNIIYASTRNTYSSKLDAYGKRGCYAEKYADARILFPAPSAPLRGEAEAGGGEQSPGIVFFRAPSFLMTFNTLRPTRIRKILMNTCTRRPKQFD